MIEEKSLSRRSFLAGAGIVTGAAIVAAGTDLIRPKSTFAAAPAFPWPYVPAAFTTIEISAIKQSAYNYYYDNGGCMSGTGKALVVAIMGKLSGDDLAKWETFPQDLFTYGGGGVNSWGTICGALHGAAFVISAVAPTGTRATNLIDDLFQWYCGNPFPSTDHDGYLRSTGTPNQPTSICNSPLCHASVSKWCTTYGKKVGSYDKKDRCAKLAGDVAGKAAELLNASFYGTYATAFVQPDTTCSGCHVTGGAQKWVQAKTTCTTMCHTVDRNPCTR